MGYEVNPGLSTAIAGATLTGNQYHLVRFNGAGRVVLCGDGEAAIGVLYSGGTIVDGDAVSVATSGIVKVVAGAAITPGARLKANVSGRAVDAVLGRTNTSDAGAAVDALLGSNIAGFVWGEIGTTANGTITQMMLAPQGAAPTTPA